MRVPVRAGQVLALGSRSGPGLRAYVLVQGGFDVGEVLGSASTFTLGGFGGHGGRELRTGDVLHLHARSLLLADLVAEPPPELTDAWELAGREGALLACLDGVTDPHNLGAVCRSAEGAGATGVVVPEHNAARVTPAVCRASAGAVEHLPVAVVVNLARYLGEVKRADLWAWAVVETAEQAEFLRGRGVEHAQGWHFGKPAEMAQLRSRLDAEAGATRA